MNYFIFFVYIIWWATCILEGFKVDECPENPTLQIIGRDRTLKSLNVQTGNENDTIKWYYFPTPKRLEFVCTSKYPIDILIDGQVPALVKSVRFERIIENISDPSTFCYKIQFEVPPSNASTGNYTCKKICGDCFESSSVFIFMDDVSGPVLLNHQSKQSIHLQGNPDSSGLLTIPCIITNPNLKPKLLKLENKDELFPKYSSNIQYSKFHGFRINVISVLSPFVSKFMCEFMNPSNQTQFINVEISKTIINQEYYVVNPYVYIPGSRERETTVLYFNRNQKIELTCESNVPIHMEWNPKWSTNKLINKYFECSDKFYKYEVRLEGLLDGNGTTQEFEASCKTNFSSRVLKVWKYKSIPEADLKASDSIMLTNDKDYPIRCKGFNSQDELSILIIECEDELNCQIANKFSYLVWNNKDNRDNYPFNIREGQICSDCTTKKDKPKVASVSHKLLDNGRKRGIIKCKHDIDGEIIIKEMNFVIGFDNSIITQFSDPRRITQGLRITIEDYQDGNKIHYVDEELNITCEAASGFYSFGLQIAFEMENGNIQVISKKLNNAVYSNGSITLNVMAKIFHQNITGVYCFGPYWNVPEWGNVSKSIQVEEGTYPKIIHNNDDGVTYSSNTDKDTILNLSLGETNQTIECEFWGVPTPIVRWFKDNNEITATNDKVHSIQCFGNVSQLILREIKESHDGKWQCFITNVKGNTSKTFLIKIIPKSNPDSESTKIIAIAVSSAVALIAVSLIAYLCFRSKLNSDKAANYLTEIEIMEFHHGNEDLRKKYAELNDNARYLPYKHDFEIPKDKLELDEDRLLGSGAFGMVLHGVLTRHGQKLPVAVKTVRSSADIQELRTLLSEVKIMMYLDKHPNIVELIGAITKELREGKLFVIVEFCSNGNLQTVLRNSRETFTNQIHPESKELDFSIDNTDELNARKSQLRAVSWRIEDFDTNASGSSSGRHNSISKSFVKTKHLIQWALEVTQGMEYLVQKNVIHGDLACRNLLLNHEWVIKITDFGLSNHLYEYANYIKKRKEEPVPWRWLSIEAIKDSKFSVFSDVWAFGISLWEIFSLAETPYQSFCWGDEFVRELNQGYRLPIPDYATNEIYEIMLKCWEADVGKRPNFTTLKEIFEQILSSTTTAATTSTASTTGHNTLSPNFT